MRAPILLSCLAIFGASLSLGGCGGSDRCEAPTEGKALTLSDMTLVDKANALGVPPDEVPAPPAPNQPQDAIDAGIADNQRAEAVYRTYLDRKNATIRIDYCIASEAYKARTMKDDMTVLSRAVMATCKTEDEPAVLAALLKYRNCAAGH